MKINMWLFRLALKQAMFYPINDPFRILFETWHQFSTIYVYRTRSDVNRLIHNFVTCDEPRNFLAVSWRRLSCDDLFWCIIFKCKSRFWVLKFKTCNHYHCRYRAWHLSCTRYLFAAGPLHSIKIDFAWSCGVWRPAAVFLSNCIVRAVMSAYKLKEIFESILCKIWMVFCQKHVIVLNVCRLFA